MGAARGWVGFAHSVPKSWLRRALRGYRPDAMAHASRSPVFQVAKSFGGEVQLTCGLPKRPSHC
eukprot:3848148-Prorocentrum_lima.AAC.1